MEPRLQPVFTRESTPQAGGAVVESQNRVLRNTYWLLALSMLPTIAGAWAGMQFNFIALFKAAPIMTPLLMFGVDDRQPVRRHPPSQQHVGHRGAVRLYVHRRRDADADPHGCGSVQERRSAGRRWRAE